MCRINKQIRFLVAFGLVFSIQSYAQTSSDELFTLFTTQQERELINNNRYKTDQIKKDVVEAKIDIPKETDQANKVEQEKVTVSIKLSGFTLAKSGQNVAWINGEPYESGSELDDGSKIYITGKLNAQVQIKTPDGKYHTVTTGEPVDLSYFKPVEG